MINQILKSKKPLIVSPSLKMGGIERALTDLANYFVDQNLDVVFVSCFQGKAFIFSVLVLRYQNLDLKGQKTHQI
jgi:hypothetical protein